MGLENGNAVYGKTSSGDYVPLLADTSNRLSMAPGGDYSSDFNKTDVFTKLQTITLSASGDIKATPGFIVSAYVVSSSSGTIRLRDGDSSGTIKFGDASTAVSVSAGDWIRFGGAVEFGTDIYFELASGSASINFYYI